MSPRDRLQRRVIPRAIVALSTIRRPARAAAGVRRALGRPGRVDLYVAFDDPSSAVALLGLTDRLSGRQVELRVAPVVERGIPADPAVDDKRAYAVIDAARLARRSGLELARGEPLAPEATAFLARWAAGITDPAARAAFSAAAMRRLWFETDGPVVEDDYAGLLPGEAPAAAPATVARTERSMAKAGLYDTPIAVVHRQWFFAHERLPAIEQRLDELGWVAA